MRLRRRRKNPSTGLKRHASLKRRAAAAGLSTKGTSATLAARLAAGKKAARKRRRRKATRKNPSRKRRSRRVARKNPPRRRRRRARRNPAASTVAGLRSQAKAMGIKTTGNKAALRARVQAARDSRAGDLRKAAGRRYGRGKDPKRVAAGKKAARTRARRAGGGGGKRSGKRRGGRRLTRAGAARKARRARRVTGKYTRSARRILRSSPKRSRRRSIARSYMSARSISRRVKKGYIKGADAKLARVYGLTKINPSIQGAAKDFGRTVLPVILPGFAAFVGAASIGHMLGHKLAARVSNPTLQRAIVPATGFAVTGVAYTVLKMSSKMQRYAMPVAVGGSLATLLLWFLNTKVGQDIAAKLKLPITLKEISAAPATAEKALEDGAKDMQEGKTAGLGSLDLQALVGKYMTVDKYMGGLGALTVHESPKNWYGRSDMGRYVGAGAQNALGLYAESNYPVHVGTPGDNIRPMAKLLNGFGAMALKDTPGGTEVSLGGMFEGDTAI